jgi:hypothetical protein
MYEFHSNQCNLCDMRQHQLESSKFLAREISKVAILCLQLKPHALTLVYIRSATFLMKCSQTERRFVFQAGEILITQRFWHNAFKYPVYIVTYMQSLNVCKYVEHRLYFNDLTT